MPRAGLKGYKPKGDEPTGFTINPPVEPMLAKLTEGMPEGDNWIYEPKWDGFRAIVFKEGDTIFTQSRDLKPLDRYFPELLKPYLASFPKSCVIDGEIVVAGDNGLEFETLQQRLHPAASRVEKLSKETPASFVAFDLLALDGKDMRGALQRERRQALESVLQDAPAPIHLTSATRDRGIALEWFQRFEGGGIDGVIARPLDQPYMPGKRVLAKVKHSHTADCVVAGFRWHKDGPGTLIGSLLLGLYDAGGTLHHVGVTSAFPMTERRRLAEELAPLREDALKNHPWREWAEAMQQNAHMPQAGSRWSVGKDMRWEPLQIERVVEVKYDQLQGDRFRHGGVFVRFRPDKTPADCTYAQLDVTPPEELAQIFKASY